MPRYSSGSPLSRLCGQMKKPEKKVDRIVKYKRTRRCLLPIFDSIKLVPAEEAKSTSVMPAVNMEEAALLRMDDLAMINLQLRFPALNLDDSVSTPCEERVRTDRGDIVVGVQGDRAKPAIITYHDLGVNYICLQPFFNYVDMQALAENFCVFHVNAPGQENGAPTLPEDYVYPTMEEMANQINYVMTHFELKTFIGFGVGVGANILAKFAILYPEKVDALALVNCCSTQASWLEWACHKINTRTLHVYGMAQVVLDYLMWHHFGRKPEERNLDLTQAYRTHFTRNVNTANLAHFIESYVRRPDLGISRDGESIKVPVLNITGAMSPHIGDTVTFNGRLNPNISTWMKISDCGSVLDEQPSKVSEAFRLFLQGQGYVAPLSPTKITEYRRASVGAAAAASLRRRACRISPVIHITENPISEAVVC